MAELFDSSASLAPFPARLNFAHTHVSLEEGTERRKAHLQQKGKYFAKKTLKLYSWHFQTQDFRFRILWFGNKMVVNFYTCLTVYVYASKRARIQQYEGEEGGGGFSLSSFPLCPPPPGFDRAWFGGGRGNNFRAMCAHRSN